MNEDVELTSIFDDRKKTIPDSDFSRYEWFNKSIRDSIERTILPLQITFEKSVSITSKYHEYFFPNYSMKDELKESLKILPQSIQLKPRFQNPLAVIESPLLQEYLQMFDNNQGSSPSKEFVPVFESTTYYPGDNGWQFFRPHKPSYKPLGEFLSLYKLLLNAWKSAPSELCKLLVPYILEADPYEFQKLRISV